MTSEPSLVQSVSTRVQSLDFLRGIVMVIMALDHVRDYFHADAFLYNPTDLDKTTAAIFFTRWITHFCAPTFVFLAGTSAFLSGQKKSRNELSAFLFKRGLWLIILDLTIIYFGWSFDPGFNVFFVNVVTVIGISMILMAGLIQLPIRLIFAFGLIAVVGHNLLDGIRIEGNTPTAFIWALLHQMQSFSYDGIVFFVGYPIIPWVGVMALGYCLGSLYSDEYEPMKRRKILILAGSSALVLFIILRAGNFYGDAAHWSTQSTSAFSILSFLNTSKYPPSLLYLLMTLGPALLFLALAERTRGKMVNVVSIFGRVPLFYYVVHIYFIHLLAIPAIGMSPGFSWTDMIFHEPLWFTEKLKGYGFSLGIVYLVWIFVVVSLYPLCRWYHNYKMDHKHNKWLSYL
jgi:uncharacterized membrane protein